MLSEKFFECVILKEDNFYKPECQNMLAYTRKGDLSWIDSFLNMAGIIEENISREDDHPMKRSIF
jgi:hypothetical protein